jgi:thymidylate kinase
LEKNRIVIMDRYIYTQIIRDTVRGLSQEYVESIYGFAAAPDLIYYLTIDPQVALDRITKRQEEPGFYESGCDIHPGLDRRSSFIRFQTMCQAAYKRIFQRVPTLYLDANQNSDVVASEAIAHLSGVMGLEKIGNISN